jgi:hypothetical protein
MANFEDAHHFEVNDEYMTRKSAWEDIFPYIPKKFKNGNKNGNTVVWEAFYGSGTSAKYLREMGFKVYSKDEDFFKVTKKKLESKGIGLIITNPAFSRKQEAFERLKELGIPFVVLVPTTVLHTLYFKNVFEGDKDIQLIFPYRKRQFDKMGLKPGEKQNDNCSFYTVYICWKVKMNKNIIFF